LRVAAAEAVGQNPFSQAKQVKGLLLSSLSIKSDQELRVS
jgi:hypothetical protein